MDPSLRILLCADLSVIGSDPPDKPLSIPQDILRGLLHLFRGFGIIQGIGFASEVFCELHKVFRRPDKEEAYHRALTAAKVQAVIPVCPQSAADTISSHMLCGKIEDPHQMFIDSSAAFISKWNDLICKGGFTGFPDVLHDC